jgi:hypothetical protein
MLSQRIVTEERDRSLLVVARARWVNTAALRADLALSAIHVPSSSEKLIHLR